MGNIFPGEERGSKGPTSQCCPTTSARSVLLTGPPDPGLRRPGALGLLLPEPPPAVPCHHGVGARGVRVVRTGSGVLSPQPRLGPSPGQTPSPLRSGSCRSSTFGSLPPLRGGSYFSAPIFVCLSPFSRSFVFAGGEGGRGGAAATEHPVRAWGAIKGLSMGLVMQCVRTHARPGCRHRGRDQMGKHSPSLIVLHLWEGED